MSIIDNYDPVKYTGNGVTKNFAFNFRGFDETYIKVRLEEIATGIQTLLTLTTDYTVTLDENTASGTVSLLVVPTSDYYIIITREMSYEQIVPYSNSRSFDAERIETSFDKNVALSQENREKLNRGVTLPVGTTGINLTIPVPVANRCIKYNSAGDNLEVSLYDPDEMVGLAEGFATSAGVSASSASNSANLAEGFATSVGVSANLAESWAIDDIGDRPEGSSKYWAEQSELSVTGKANTDLDNLSATGEARFIKYTTCTTAGSTANKTADLSGFTLLTGSVVDVVFTNANTSVEPTLDINGTGAKQIAHENGVSVSVGNPAFFPAGAVIRFIYDGAKWRFKNVVVIASYTSGPPSGYRIWADGYKEYYGRTGESGTTGLYNFTHTFAVPFERIQSMVAHRGPHSNFGNNASPKHWYAIYTLTATSITFVIDANNSQYHYWSVRGY